MSKHIIRCGKCHNEIELETEEMGAGVVGGCGLSPIQSMKMAVIKAAFGIQSLSEPELLDRLGNLYIEGIKTGIK